MSRWLCTGSRGRSRCRRRHERHPSSGTAARQVERPGRLEADLERVVLDALARAQLLVAAVIQLRRVRLASYNVPRSAITWTIWRRSWQLRSGRAGAERERAELDAVPLFRNSVPQVGSVVFRVQLALPTPRPVGQPWVVPVELRELLSTSNGAVVPGATEGLGYALRHLDLHLLSVAEYDTEKLALLTPAGIRMVFGVSVPWDVAPDSRDGVSVSLVASLKAAPYGWSVTVSWSGSAGLRPARRGRRRRVLRCRSSRLRRSRSEPAGSRCLERATPPSPRRTRDERSPATARAAARNASWQSVVSVVWPR